MLLAFIAYDMMVEEDVKQDEVVTIEKAYDNYEDYVMEFKKWMKNRDKWLKENL